jgi:hypothetical protein
MSCTAYSNSGADSLLRWRWQAVNGLGLQAEVKDHCQLLLKYPKRTNSTWVPISNNFFKSVSYLKINILYRHNHLLG